MLVKGATGGRPDAMVLMLCPYCMHNEHYDAQGPFLLTWLNFNPGMDK